MIAFAVLSIALASVGTLAQSWTQPVRLYSEGSAWNTPIAANAPVDPNSAALVSAAIARYSRSAVLANTEKWGVPAVFATQDSKSYSVACTKYCPAPSVQFRISKSVRAASGSDHHLAVIDGDRELDLWQATYDPSRDAWSASTVVIADARGRGAICDEGSHCNAANAAGFALLAGLVWPQELRGGRIRHALALTTPFTRAGYIACPATHTDGRQSDPAAIPEGARIQLDPAFDVAAQPWPSWEKAVAVALQQYGAFVVDTGGALAVRGVSDVNLRDNSWAAAGIPTEAGLSDLPWDRMRVLQLRRCN